ncbi:hypothetical protein Lesp02_83680 [Lentzea sp. NBRC 105346]|uniref:hypothetical protein n=1 Tax=Lentzea sp. NBRC 105346 TaxID=3032205 RepID=UPI0024A17FF7|nr:hypothetical protein [Lentzea sp. NBRC 105346]GLZ36181.1 hypothetical protein Lesp02_83680 [Lentzea sp. NBRC 105346]
MTIPLTGQVAIVTAVIGLTCTGSSAFAGNGFGFIQPQTQVSSSAAASVVDFGKPTSTSAVPPANTRIIFTVSDQPSAGATEETIYISFDGIKVTTLHAS